MAQSPIPALETLRTPLGVWEDLTVSGEMTLEGVHGRTLRSSSTSNRSTPIAPNQCTVSESSGTRITEATWIPRARAAGGKPVASPHFRG
ncbi:MAG: hypothetical protein IPK19_07435 [Chloroflexi bacterium]|nr:hypothetical protein [Chloroflexota bacterium]